MSDSELAAWLLSHLHEDPATLSLLLPQSIPWKCVWMLYKEQISLVNVKQAELEVLVKSFAYYYPEAILVPHGMDGELVGLYIFVKKI